MQRTLCISQREVIASGLQRGAAHLARDCTSLADAVPQVLDFTQGLQFTCVTAVWLLTLLLLTVPYRSV